MHSKRLINEVSVAAMVWFEAILASSFLKITSNIWLSANWKFPLLEIHFFGLRIKDSESNQQLNLKYSSAAKIWQHVPKASDLLNWEERRPGKESTEKQRMSPIPCQFPRMGGREGMEWYKFTHGNSVPSYDMFKHCRFCGFFPATLWDEREAHISSSGETELLKD